MQGSQLRVEKLSVAYGAIQAVRDLHFSLGPEEVVAVLGVNGAGKSSLLNAIAGIAPTTQGVVSFGSERLTGLSPQAIVHRGLALCPEGRRVFPGLTVKQNLDLGGIAARKRSDRSRVMDEILDRFPALRLRLTQLAGTLSGGEQQMLAIGRALMSEPKVLLLDEPSLGLGPKIADEVFQHLEELRARGVAMLLVEQDAVRALTIADRALMLAHGRLEREDSAANLLADKGLADLYFAAGEQT